MASLAAVPDQAEPLAEWLEPSLQDTAGRDPLGLNTITLDRILPQLIPGILQLSERARYFSIYPWMLWQFAERKRPATREELDQFIRRREFELCLAMKLCQHCDAYKAIGGLSASPRVNAGDDPFNRGLSVESDKGGFGLYYRSPLFELGAVAPVGTPLGPEGKPTPIEVLLKDERAITLATSFHEAIKDTEYYERYERTNDPIPRQVLADLAERVCPCRLPYREIERDAIRALMFSPADQEEQVVAACDARRRAFALFLLLMDADAEVAYSTEQFWRALIGRFLADPTATGATGETTAAWAALAMKECVQEALCSIWTHFCRTGVREQGLDGMTNDELRAMIRSLADGHTLELDGTRAPVEPDEPVAAARGRLVPAARGMDWEAVRAWTAEANTAVTGLAALLIYADRLPDPSAVHPLWGAIGARHSEHQDGLMGVISLVRHRQEAEPTVAELLDWIIRRFIIGPHEVIAYSKLPKATFRFSWEETGRLRFFTPGSGGLDRFNPSDDRRGTMALLSEDIGYWRYDEKADAGKLTTDGRAFVAEVLG